jgi:Protein of unknown function (DUF2934)
MTSPGSRQTHDTAKTQIIHQEERSIAPDAHPNETAAGPPLSHEEIASRAYALFLARGGQHGDDLGDWLRAEAALREERDQSGRPSES